MPADTDTDTTRTPNGPNGHTLNVLQLRRLYLELLLCLARGTWQWQLSAQNLSLLDVVFRSANL